MAETVYSDSLNTALGAKWLVSDDPWGGGTPACAFNDTDGPAEDCIEITGNSFGGKGMTYDEEIPADWESVKIQFDVWTSDNANFVNMGLIFSSDKATKTIRESTNQNDANEADDYYSVSQRGSFQDEHILRNNSGTTSTLRANNDLGGTESAWKTMYVEFTKEDDKITIARSYDGAGPTDYEDTSADRHTGACYAHIGAAYASQRFVKNFVMTVNAPGSSSGGGGRTGVSDGIAGGLSDVIGIASN